MRKVVDLESVERRIVRATQRQLRAGVRLRRGTYGLYAGKGFDGPGRYRRNLGLGCMCPIGCLLLGKPAGPAADYDRDAAALLGVPVDFVRGFVAGFDAPPGRPFGFGGWRQRGNLMGQRLRQRWAGHVENPA